MTRDSEGREGGWEVAGDLQAQAPWVAQRCQELGGSTNSLYDKR